MSNPLRATSLLAAVSLLAGCASTTPALDAGFGESLMTIKARQTRDPAAALRQDSGAVDVIEGRTASNTMERYYQSFALPPAPMNIINIGAPASTPSR
jgi:hypothetical protein